MIIHTVEATYRFKEFDWIEYLKNYGQRFGTLYIQKAGVKTILKKKKCKKEKWLSQEALQLAVKRRKAKGKGEKKRYTHLNAEFQRIARKDKKAFFNDQSKEQSKTIEWERLDISSRKLEIPRDIFMQRWAQ